MHACVALLCLASAVVAQDATPPSARAEPAGAVDGSTELPHVQAAPVEAATGEVMTFARAVELALDSGSVRAAEAQLEVARLSLESALAPLSATASVDARTATDFGGQGATVDLELAVNAALRTGWGASGEAVAAARRSLEAAEGAVRAARSDAAQRAVRLYAEALAAEAASGVARLRLEMATVRADAARARSAAGAALEAEVTRAELDELSAELDLRAAEAALAAAYTSLSLELGTRVTGVEGGLPAGSPPDTEHGGEAVAARGDVMAARRDLEAAADALAQALRASGINLSANVAVSGSSGGTSLSVGAGMDTRDRTPTLSSRLATSMGSVGAGASPGAPSVRASVGVSATVPLGPPNTRVAAAEAAYAQAEARLNEVIARANLEVAALAVQVEADAARLQVAESRAALAQAASDDAATRFELGVVSWIDVLQARVAVLQASGEVRAAHSSYLQGLMALARATGKSATEGLR